MRYQKLVVETKFWRLARFTSCGRYDSLGTDNEEENVKIVDCLTFWGTVKEKLGNEGYEELRRVLWAKYPSPAEQRDASLPYMRRAAELNGCADAGSYEASSQESFNAYIEVSGEYPNVLHPCRCTPEELERLKAIMKFRYDAIAATYARERKCHKSPDFELVCYCDEKKS